MRKIGLILGILLFFNTNSNATKITNDELIDLNQIVMNDYSIEKWSVVIKEKLTPKQLARIHGLLQEDYMIEVSEMKHSHKYSAQMTQKNGSIIETYSIVIPKNQQYSPEFTVSIEGKLWNKEMKEIYQERSKQIMDKFFTNKANRYTCVTATSNDIMIGINFSKKIKRKLNLKNISKQFDTIEHSTNKKIIYGYTPIWDNNIKVLDQRLNIQMVFQSTDNGKSKIIIGTPILISEY